MGDLVPHAFVVVGPTAAGKSSVAQYIAEREGQLIVSADSMNIYRGLDIGTAKASVSDRERADYVGVDLAEPTEKFNVGDYLRAVSPAIKTAAAANRPVIVAGGTGLYVKCLIEGLDDMPVENPELRARLEKLDVSALQSELLTKDPIRFEALADRQNPRRLVRALELAEQGAPLQTAWRTQTETPVVGLRMPRELLLRRIEKRVGQMYAEGLLEEARGLIDLELSATALAAIGYSEAFAVLRGEITEAQAKERTIIRTRQLAKRQMTWLRNQLNVTWVDLDEEQPSLAEVADKVKAAWSEFGPVALSI
jgi:tRNA dimethylallyltransferase